MQQVWFREYLQRSFREWVHLGIARILNKNGVLAPSEYKAKCGEKYITGFKGAGQSKTLSSTLKGIATNPIILSIVAGVILSVLNVHFPKMLDNTISNFSKMATPLALIAIGGSFEFGKALQKIKPAVIATAMKLVGWALVFLPIAIWLGYRDAKLMAIVIMLASPATPSCYIMSRSMHSEGTLTSSVIVLTTMCSAFTITAIIYILRAIGLV